MIANDFFNLMGTIVILAIVTIALSKNSNTAGVLSSWFGGFSGSLRSAEGH